MRMYLLAETTPGQQLALPAMNADGQVLVNAGVKLTQRILDELEKRAFQFVYIEDEETSGIEINDAVSEATRHTTLNQMASSVNGLSTMSERFKGESSRSVALALEDQSIQDEIAEAGELNSLVGASVGIVGDILESDTAAGLNTIRTHHERAHTLALDSAIAAVVLGKRLNLPTDRLQALATGTVLHDIGLSVLDPDFVEAEELDLSPEDFDRYRAHPLLGYKILRNRFGSDMQPAQIAYQHHERQDGTGYPRGLSGTTQLKRSVQRQGGGGPDSHSGRNRCSRNCLRRVVQWQQAPRPATAGAGACGAVGPGWDGIERRGRQRIPEKLPYVPGRHRRDLRKRCVCCLHRCHFRNITSGDGPAQSAYPARSPGRENQPH